MTNQPAWISIFPNIKFENTVKQYFNKYCFKLVLFSPGGRAIYNKTLSVEKSLEIRQQINKTYNYAGSWRVGGAGRYLNLADATLLNYIKEKKKELKDVAKFRVEEPFVTVYSDDETVLFEFAKNLPEKSLDRVELFTGPESRAAMDLLKRGSILLAKPTNYNFKITLRDGRYSADTKLNLFAYLDQLGDEISLPKSCRKHLARNTAWMYGVYFYCNDEKIVTMLNLIEPNIVRNINSLVYTSNE